jgi:HD-GYP domain-containing protein (c-di-GMP phosphodiesterase class II)
MRLSSEQKVKLLERGSPIHSGVLEHLIRHKLLKPLDECITVDNAVTGKSLLSVAKQMLENDALLAHFQSVLPPKYRLSTLLPQLPLPAPIAVRLTLAREERPELFTHSLLALIVSGYIAGRSGLTLDQTLALSAAALCHDLGLLHIDPAILNPHHRLSEAERKHLYAHPVIGGLALEAMKEYPTSVSRAVYEHHERLDGSGYPRGLKGNDISKLGQMLAVSEIVTSRFDEQGQCRACQQLEFILKMNASKLNPAYVRLFSPFYEDLQRADALARRTDRQQVLKEIQRLLSLLQAWRNLTQRGTTGLAPAIGGFIEAQLQSLHKTLSNAGLNLADLEQLLALDDEEGVLLEELAIVVQETRWQLRSLWHELLRRWPSLSTDAVHTPASDWLGRLRQI